MGVPQHIDPSVWVHPTAVLLGDISIGENSSVWPYAVMRGDYNSIQIGAWSNVQDTAVIHTGSHPTRVGDYVSVAHGAVLHACTVEDVCMIGIHATVMDGAVIGTGSLVGANTLVREGQIIPPHSVVVGVPGTVIKTTQEHLSYIKGNAQSYYELSLRHRTDDCRFALEDVLAVMQQYQEP